MSIPVIASLGWVAVSWIRAHYGITGPFGSKRHGWKSDPENTHVPPMFSKMLEKAMAERDTEINKLRERIEVLEKIVTDNHKVSTLADEMERLRDKA